MNARVFLGSLMGAALAVGLFFGAKTVVLPLSFAFALVTAFLAQTWREALRVWLIAVAAYLGSMALLPLLLAKPGQGAAWAKVMGKMGLLSAPIVFWPWLLGIPLGRLASRARKY